MLIAALQIDPIASAERNIRWSQRDPTFQAMQRQITGNMMWRYGRSRGNDEVNGLEPVGFDQRGRPGGPALGSQCPQMDHFAGLCMLERHSQIPFETVLYNPIRQRANGVEVTGATEYTSTRCQQVNPWNGCPETLVTLVSEDSMARYSTGDHVSWNSEAGHVSGRIIKLHDRDFDYKGHRHRASKEAPQYEIASDKTDHIAAHKEDALKTID
ncbi:DUF2945 family protein [Novosphingobium sp. ST904]|nr:DUF2945 family protein [Novosphingobium sp. ST904]